MTTTSTIRAATEADTHAVSVVLARAFADDPVFTWCIPDAGRRRAMLPGFFALFAQAYQPLGASQVVNCSGTLDTAGAALWTPSSYLGTGYRDYRSHARADCIPARRNVSLEASRSPSL